MKSLAMSDQGMALLCALAAGWMALPGSPLAAQNVTGSSAFGESADLQAVPFVGEDAAVASPPLPQVSGSAVPAYARSGGVLAVSLASAPTGPILRTGRLDVGASSEMPDAVPTRGRAVAHGTLLTLGHAIPLLSLEARAIRSAAGIDGACGSGLTALGSADLSGVTTGGSLGRDLTAPDHPAPNTVLVDAPGVRVVLNEQTRTGDGLDSLELTVTAVHVYLRNALLPGLGRLSGEIVIARSRAGVRCPGPVPVADLALTGLAAGGSAAPGRRLAYTFTVTNQGLDTATAVVFAATPPAGLGAPTASASQGSCSASTPVICTLGDLATGQSVEVTVEGTASRSAGPLTARATVTSGVDDPDSSNNALTLTAPAAQPSGAVVPRATDSPARTPGAVPF